MQGAAVLVVPSAGQLREAVVNGIDHDPLLAAPVEKTTVAGAVALAGEPVLIASDLEGGTEGSVQLAVEKAGFASAIAVPLAAQDRLLGMLTLYGGPNRQPLDDDELELASILGATAAMGYANALAFRQLEKANTGLESTVEQRTDELRTTLEEVQRLNRELEDSAGSRTNSFEGCRPARPAGFVVDDCGRCPRSTQARHPQRRRSRFLGIIRSQAETLSEIIESVGQASMLVSETKDAHREEGSLPDLLRRAVAPLRPLAKQLEVEIKVLSPGNLETISCDAEACQPPCVRSSRTPSNTLNPGERFESKCTGCCVDPNPGSNSRLSIRGAAFPRVISPTSLRPSGRATPASVAGTRESASVWSSPSRSSNATGAGFPSPVGRPRAPKSRWSFPSSGFQPVAAGEGDRPSTAWRAAWAACCNCRGDARESTDLVVRHRFGPHGRRWNEVPD